MFGFQIIEYLITIAFFSTFVFLFYLTAFNILHRFIVYDSEQLEPLKEQAMLFPAPHHYVHSITLSCLLTSSIIQTFFPAWSVD